MSPHEIFLLVLALIAGFTTWWGHRMNRRAVVAEQEVQVNETKARIEEKEKQIETEVKDESLDEIVRDSNSRYSRKSDGTNHS